MSDMAEAGCRGPWKSFTVVEAHRTLPLGEKGVLYNFKSNPGGNPRNLVIATETGRVYPLEDGSEDLSVLSLPGKVSYVQAS